MKHDSCRMAMCAGLILSMAMAFTAMAAPGDCPCAGGTGCAAKPAVRAADWVAAWQAAREACPAGDTVTLTFVERSGLRSEMQKSAAVVELSAVGEAVMITVKAGGASVESVAIIRASDLVKVEITRREGGAK